MNNYQDSYLCKCNYCSAFGCLCEGRALWLDIKRKPFELNLSNLLTK